MAADPYVKQYLMTPGPTPLPPAVSLVMAQPMTYHRAPAFVEVYARALKRLPQVFGTQGDVLLFAASGTGAMESAVSNLIRPGDAALVVSCGKFGERWAELCDAYGAATVHEGVEWGTKIDARRGRPACWARTRRWACSSPRCPRPQRGWSTTSARWPRWRMRMGR